MNKDKLISELQLENSAYSITVYNLELRINKWKYRVIAASAVGSAIGSVIQIVINNIAS